MSGAAHTDWTEIAARNNADWCVAVWRSHGLPVRRTPGLVFCPAPTPPFYPNAVTVSRDADPRALARFIGELREAAGLEAFSVKDSFACLDLAPIGLEPLFDARWIHRARQPNLRRSLYSWESVRSEFDLKRWEDAWGQRPAGAAHIFRPELLEDPNTYLVSGFWRGEQIIEAGGIAHRAAGVVGLSNLFGPDAAFLEVAPSLFLQGGEHLVGYERGSDLKMMEKHGFSALGSLRVWAAV